MRKYARMTDAALAHTPDEIETMAREAGLSMNETCRRAGLHRSTFTKWKAGRGLTIGSYNQLIEVIAAAKAEVVADAAQ